MPHTYPVYNKVTDMPIIISGTAKACAAAMGLTVGSFRTIYTKIKNGNVISRKWEIYQDEEVNEGEYLK